MHNPKLRIFLVIQTSYPRRRKQNDELERKKAAIMKKHEEADKRVSTNPNLTLTLTRRLTSGLVPTLT